MNVLAQVTNQQISSRVQQILKSMTGIEEEKAQNIFMKPTTIEENNTKIQNNFEHNIPITKNLN